MKRLSAMLVAALALAAFASIASATPRVDARQVRQHARIQQGVRSGELTRGEIHRLRAGQRQLRRVERRAEFNGTVNARERARLERLQDRESQAIRRLKHNRRGC